MKRVLAVFLMVGVLGCGVVDEARPPLSDEVAGFLESYLLSLETRDGAALRTFYADGDRFEWIEDGEIRYRSADEVLAGLAALPSDAAIHTEYENRTVIPVGTDGARVSARFRTVIGEGPAAFEFGGMMTMVLEKGPTGWRIVGGHTSSARAGR